MLSSPKFTLHSTPFYHTIHRIQKQDRLERYGSEYKQPWRELSGLGPILSYWGELKSIAKIMAVILQDPVCTKHSMLQINESKKSVMSTNVSENGRRSYKQTCASPNYTLHNSGSWMLIVFWVFDTKSLQVLNNLTGTTLHTWLQMESEVGSRKRGEL